MANSLICLLKCLDSSMALAVRLALALGSKGKQHGN
jgi:hypothetical protein